MKSPAVSIVTACLNRAPLISEAIESVLQQDLPDIEHIVVDGGSTDGTLEVLNRYPHLRVISEPDLGMYDALNKGIDLAGGEIIGFLNSDDLYTEEIFSEIADRFGDERILAVAGRAIVFLQSANGGETIINNFSPEDINLIKVATLGNPFINAWFFRKALFGKIGKFNSNFRIAGDREFMLRFALNKPAYATLDKLVYRYRQHVRAMTFDITDQKLEQIVREHIKMTSSFLKRHDLPRQARQLIRQLRTRDTLAMAVLAARNGEFRKMFFFMAAGIRYDLIWGGRLALYAAKKIFRRISIMPENSA